MEGAINWKWKVKSAWAKLIKKCCHELGIFKSRDKRVTAIIKIAPWTLKNALNKKGDCDHEKGINSLKSATAIMEKSLNLLKMCSSPLFWKRRRDHKSWPDQRVPHIDIYRRVNQKSNPTSANITPLYRPKIIDLDLHAHLTKNQVEPRLFYI